MDVPSAREAEHLGQALVGEPLRLVEHDERLRVGRSGEQLRPDERQIDGQKVTGDRFPDRRRIAGDHRDPTGRHEFSRVEHRVPLAEHPVKDRAPDHFVQEAARPLGVFRAFADPVRQFADRRLRFRGHDLPRPSPVSRSVWASARVPVGNEAAARTARVSISSSRGPQ